MAKQKDVPQEQVKKNPFQTITENLPFHDFEKEPNFIGIYEKSLTLGEKEPFNVNVFLDKKTDKRVFVTDAHTINKVIGKCKSDGYNLSEVVFNILFEGKTEVNGKPFNKFTISLCTLKEYNEYFK